jgi:hypothetical protein
MRWFSLPDGKQWREKCPYYRRLVAQKLSPQYRKSAKLHLTDRQKTRAGISAGLQLVTLFRFHAASRLRTLVT